MAKSLNDIYFSLNRYPFRVVKVARTVSYSKVPIGTECVVTGFDYRCEGFYTYNLEDGQPNPTLGLDPFEENWELKHKSERSIKAIEDLFKPQLPIRVFKTSGSSILKLFVQQGVK